MADDTPAVIDELRRLRNTRYHDRPVSLPTERDADLRADTQRLARELPDNLFGRDVWERFETATRTFLASAEAVFRARRDDPAFDFSGPAVEYAKAVETELNALVFPRLRSRLEGGMLKDREVRTGGAGRAAPPRARRHHRPRPRRRVHLHRRRLAPEHRPPGAEGRGGAAESGGALGGGGAGAGRGCAGVGAGDRM